VILKKNFVGRMLVILVALSGCADLVGLNQMPIKNRFDSAEVEWSKKPGTSNLKGSGFLRLPGGQILTCAGLGVSLVPVSKHAEERYFAVYKTLANDNNIHKSQGDSPRVEANEQAFFSSFNFTSVCDATGKFEFKSLAAGNYFLEVSILWEEGNWRVYCVEGACVPGNLGNTQLGRHLMKRIVIGEGENREEIISATFP
jgi:hypothetical protein